MPSSRVAVIGAGAAGLVAARELRREGHTPVVFERAAGVGGTWRYDDAASADPLGAGGVHGSLYASLRTNLPRECMGFLDFPFVAGTDGDPRRFPGHQEVLRYLEAFARRFHLLGLLRLETEVVSVRRSRVNDDPGAVGWTVSYRSRKLAGASSEVEEEVFDAVVVCNGHFAEPRLADIAGYKQSVHVTRPFLLHPPHQTLPQSTHTTNASPCMSCTRLVVACRRNMEAKATTAGGGR